MLYTQSVLAAARQGFCVREYGFELRLCAHLETDTGGIVARQVGGAVHDTGSRVLDTVVIAPGQEFDTRRRITGAEIPARAIHSPVGVGRARRWSQAIDASPETANRILERAIDVGFFERVQHNGRWRVRQTTRYPDWIGSITAIENKPDLGEPGDLIDQLRLDVALGLVDRVILATASYVTAAHMNRIPDEVGIWRVHTADTTLEIEEVRAPTDLAVDDWGIELGDREPLTRAIRTVSPAAKQRARIRLAERAYGKGWRPRFPGCSEGTSREELGSRAIPYCTWKDRIIEPSGCGPACPGFTPASPPVVNGAAEREQRTQWKRDPDGFAREQVGLGGFVD